MAKPAWGKLGSQRRWRIWTGRLWILSIALGIATIISTVGIIHDSGQRHEAAGVVAATTVQQVAAATHERLMAIRDTTGIAFGSLPLDSARLVAHRVFSDIIASSATLAHLDSTSLRVSRMDGATLFGSLASDHLIRGSYLSHAPDGGLHIDVALTPDQVPHVLLMPVHPLVLAHNGVLFLSTILVTALAFGSSRREAALASARGDFIAGVSHDLRMPLAQILLAGETLTLHDDLNAAERSALSHSIVRESKRLIALVENLLLFSRSGATSITPRRDVLPVRRLLDDSVDAVQLAADDVDQTIRIDVTPGLAIVGDARLLQQALLNVLGNAMKYGPRGQEILIEARATGSAVRITVDDHGPGIPPAERGRVLEPYERLARDQESERTGTGLGLAVVAYIVHASGGRVSIEDAPGGGARVMIELPQALSPEHAQADVVATPA